MAYPGYTPTPPPTGTAPQTPQAYPYGAYHPSPYGHPSAVGAYTYPPGAYQAGVTSYGWTYPYNYVPQPHLQMPAAAAQVTTQHVQRPPITPVTHTPTVPAPVPQRAATFTAYTPSYVRETVPSTHSGGRGGGRRQSNLKGLFSKECESE